MNTFIRRRRPRPDSNFLVPEPLYLKSGVQFECYIPKTPNGIPVKSNITPLPEQYRAKFTKSSLFGRSQKWIFIEKHKLRKKYFHALRQHMLALKENKLCFTLHKKCTGQVHLQIILKEIYESNSPFDTLFE